MRVWRLPPGVETIPPEAETTPPEIKTIPPEVKTIPPEGQTKALRGRRQDSMLASKGLAITIAPSPPEPRFLGSQFYRLIKPEPETGVLMRYPSR